MPLKYESPAICGAFAFKAERYTVPVTFSIHALKNSPDRIKPSIMTILSMNE